MVDRDLNRWRTSQSSSEEWSVSPAGAPRRRLPDVPAGERPTEPVAPGRESGSIDTQPVSGIQHATLGLLDGTVIARLACHESLGTVVIGRGSAATIQVQDTFAHRVHAQISWETTSRSHVITHGGGANGTLVNLQRIASPTRLIDGARIRIGKTEIVYRKIWYPGSS